MRLFFTTIHPILIATFFIYIAVDSLISDIEAYRQDGRVFIENGHHRFAAYMELGLKPNLIIRNTGGPIGFPNWLKKGTW